MKPLNGFFVFIHGFFGPIFRFLHPLRVEGMDRLPPSGAMLCPNHSSNWDPVLLAVTLPKNYRLHIMAKDSLFHVPLLGPIVRKLGAFPVARGNSDIQSVKTAISAIKNGDNLLIFPEGTRVDREGDVAAKGGAAVIGIRTGAVFVPVFLDGKKRLFRPTRLIIGEPYRPTYTGRHGTAEEIQAIADDLLRRAYDLGREQA